MGCTTYEDTTLVPPEPSIREIATVDAMRQISGIYGGCHTSKALCSTFRARGDERCGAVAVEWAARSHRKPVIEYW